MPRTATFWVLLLLSGILLPALAQPRPAGAQSLPAAAPAAQRAANPVYTVTGVAVDASAESAASARPVALQEGQRRAFSQLLRRLVASEDHARLPQPTEALLNETVAGFEIDEERTSPTRYLGRISVRFRPDAVRALLQSARLTYSEDQARPVLILPVWQTAQAAILWDGDNPWRDIWKRRGDTDGLVPLRLADPAQGRNAAVTLESLLAAPGRLQALAEANGAGEAMLISASLVAQEERAVRIEIIPHADAGGRAAMAVEPFVVTGASIEQALSTAMEQMIRRIDSGWKQTTRLDFDRPAQISVAAEFSSLAAWVRLRDRLGETAMVRRADVLRFSHRDAQLMLDYFGDPAQLAAALAQKGIELRQRDGFWDMRLSGSAARP